MLLLHAFTLCLEFWSFVHFAYDECAFFRLFEFDGLFRFGFFFNWYKSICSRNQKVLQTNWLYLHFIIDDCCLFWQLFIASITRLFTIQMKNLPTIRNVCVCFFLLLSAIAWTWVIVKKQSLFTMKFQSVFVGKVTFSYKHDCVSFNIVLFIHRVRGSFFFI